MKKYKCIFVLLLFIGCKSYKTQELDQNSCDFDQTIKKHEKNLNIDLIIESIINDRDTVLINNDTIKSLLYKHPLNKTLTKRNTNKKTNVSKILVYSEQKNLIGSYFQYDNLDIGKEIIYDENEVITEIIDHEKGYKICWVEAIAIIKKKLEKKLVKYDDVLYVLQRADINEFPDSRPLWSVGVVPIPDDRIGETTYYKIDGVTGKYLGKFIAKKIP